MSFCLNSADWAEYIRRAYARIHANGDYVTELDLTTGDGDHWSNLDMGFGKLNEKADSYADMTLFNMMKDIGMTMMSVIGGSSGILYGSAYIAAAAVVRDKTEMDKRTLCDVLTEMLNAIIKRGQSQVGFKTMIDSLSPAVDAFEACVENGDEDIALCEKVAAAAVAGAESTKEMEAVRGRAVYQANKGVGHLDPGAVTMSYQIEELMNLVAEKVQ